MKMCDAGWVWEGQGMDPGVHPSIFGVGEGADFFGVKKCVFMFHPITELALWKLRDKEEVVCDITKWDLRDAGRGGSESFKDERLDVIESAAEKTSRLSLKYPNVTGAMHDDMRDCLNRLKYPPERYEEIYSALKSHNPNLKLWCVVYSMQLEPEQWEGFEKYMDVINFWGGGTELDEKLDRCRELFPGKPIILGCYLWDFRGQVPLPMDVIKFRWERTARYLDEGKIDGYSILGTINIEGTLEVSEWIRDFIAQHS